MADRRMISQKIVDTDKFVEMPMSARLLYYELCVRGDDDGFVSSPQKILRMIGCSSDDLKLLCAKNYIIPFESGVCVVKDWKIHNYIQADRYKPTIYTEEYAQLQLKENKEYVLDTACIHIGYKQDTDCTPKLNQIKLNQVSVNTEHVHKNDIDGNFKSVNWLGTEPDEISRAKACFRYWWNWYEPSRRGNRKSVSVEWEKQCSDWGIDVFLSRFEVAFSWYCQCKDVKQGIILSAMRFLTEWESYFDQVKAENYKINASFWDEMKGDYEKSNQ